MILYHFAPMARVEAIQREGLRGRTQGTLDPILGTFEKPVVYLTDKPTVEATDAEMALFKELPTGITIVSNRWLQCEDNESMARITLRLPSHDPRLKHYGRWLRANYHRIDGLPDPDDDYLFVRRAVSEWWLYFGDIPPSRITDFIVEEAIPYRPPA